MKSKSKFLSIAFLTLIIFSFMSSIYAVGLNENDVEVGGIDIILQPENIVIFLSSILALILFLLTLKTYFVDKRKKFLFITIAFGLFALKGFILSSELFLSEINGWIETFANFLDFGILISFFSGLLKK